MRDFLLRSVLALAALGLAACAHDLSIVATASSGGGGCGHLGEACCASGSSCLGGAACVSNVCMGSQIMDYGICGATFHACICACPAGDGTCTNNCYTSAGSTDCTMCVANGQAACCPSEDADYVQCANEAQHPTDGGLPCQTNACIEARCQTASDAYSACLANSGTNCNDYYTPCLGTAACN